MNSDFEQQYEIQAKLLYSMMVAGKSANFVDKCLRRFLDDVQSVCRWELGMQQVRALPFEMLAMMKPDDVISCLKFARTGNYTKLAKGIQEIVGETKAEKLNLLTCQPEDLEKFHGIGFKTSRFFIMWVRPHEVFAALDVHVLRWMRNNGYPDAPKATPQNSKRYRELEIAFIAEAKKRGKTPRQLDEEIWSAGAGRTQETPLP